MEIIPAIIAKSFEELSRKIKLVEPYVNWVQLDIMDGQFAPEVSWNNPEELENINTRLNLEAHLMVEDVELEVERWLGSGVKRILVHYEAVFGNQELGTGNWEVISKKCKENNTELGLALNLETSIDVLTKFQVSSSRFQVIQLMSIAQIGYYGQPFDGRVIPKIKSLREKYPNVKIAVDGGVSLKNAGKLFQAGANILAVGSAIFEADNIGEAIKNFQIGFGSK
jgi:ribulose-phosphate 3-epimerase